MTGLVEAVGFEDLAHGNVGVALEHQRAQDGLLQVGVAGGDAARRLEYALAVGAGTLVLVILSFVVIGDWHL